MKIKAIFFLLATVITTSCSEDTPSQTEDGSATLQLNILIPETVTQGGAQTRATVGPGQPDIAIPSFSLCVIPDQTANTGWYHDYLGYDNLTGKCSWIYNNSTGLHTLHSCPFTPRGTTTSLSYLGVFPTKGPVWIYGVYPAVPNFEKHIDDLEHIEYTTGNDNTTNYDYMYIDPIYMDMVGVNPGDILEQDLPFKHVMTAVEVRLTTTHIGTVVVDSIALEAFDGTDKAPVFSMKGTYSAKDGSVSPLPGHYADHLNIAYNSMVNYKYAGAVHESYTPFPFIFPTVEHKAGRKLIATIYFKYIGDDGLDLVGQTSMMEFKFDNIETAGVRQGLVGGYRYVYKAEIDNFIKYSGYPEIEEWVVPTDDPDDDQVKDIII